MRSRLVASIVGLALVLAACSSSATPVPASAPPSAPASAAGGSAAAANLQIYAASSLKAALAQVKTTYEAANPGTTLTISTDSSSALETKIEQGAPADVFLSADTANPQKLVDKGLALGAPVNFAGNLLTIITPLNNPAGIKSPLDMINPVQIIAAGDTVPITKYANMLVANLAKQPGYPPTFATLYAANIKSKEDNVAAVVSKIELGEGDVAIVYVTDAKTSTKVAQPAPIPTDANVPATYAGVVVKATQSPDASQAFLTWFAGPAGQAILAGFGFLPPPS
ncbi:MAG TPA: molybdate ABC transporter substrate-binding protein [Candidatus Binatia bacterium]|nr:molybdate ABC transporter substrate-binding protein [Candidatus Binatia bacterium]